MKFIRLFLMLFALSFLVSCQEEAIVHDLNERDANEIIVLLAKNEIIAAKQQEVRNQETFWSIVVDPSDTMQARSILVSNNLPRIRHGGLEGICKEAGLILTPKTEKCREILAYKGEIINSLESIPGVVSADVVLNIPEEEEFPDENTLTKRPTASVTIQYLSDANVKTELTEEKIQEFVSNSVSGLDARDVTVIISYFKQTLAQNEAAADSVADQDGVSISAKTEDGDSVAMIASDSESNLVSVGGLMMDETSAKKLKIVASLFLVILLLLAGAFIFALLRMAKLRRKSVTAMTDDADAKKDGEKPLLEAKA